MIHTLINVVRGFLSGDGALILPEMELVLFACGILLIDLAVGKRKTLERAARAGRHGVQRIYAVCAARKGASAA